MTLVRLGAGFPRLRLLAVSLALAATFLTAAPVRADDDDNVVTWHNLQPSDEVVDPGLDCPGARIEWSLVTFQLNENDYARQRAQDAGDDGVVDQIDAADVHGRIRQAKLQQIIDSKCPK